MIMYNTRKVPIIGINITSKQSVQDENH